MLFVVVVVVCELRGEREKRRQKFAHIKISNLQFCPPPTQWSIFPLSFFSVPPTAATPNHNHNHHQLLLMSILLYLFAKSLSLTYHLLLLIIINTVVDTVA